MRTIKQKLEDNRTTLIDKVRSINIKKRTHKLHIHTLEQTIRMLDVKKRASVRDLKIACKELKDYVPPVLWDPDAESEWAKELRLYTEAHHHRRNDEVAKLTCEECARLRAKAAEDIKQITGG